MVRRRNVLLLVILVSVLAALAGWFAGRTDGLVAPPLFRKVRMRV